VRQIRVLTKLAPGRWDYDQGHGVLNREHVRFFTRRTIRHMFLESGYTEPQFYFPRSTWHLRPPERRADQLTMGKLSDFFFGSYTLAARSG